LLLLIFLFSITVVTKPYQHVKPLVADFQAILKDLIEVSL
jgi:hypothetical protein